MKQVDKSFRPAFSRAVNDNADTENLSEEALHRALNPPHNDTEEVLHGVTVKDPFRPLEQLDDPETAAWVQRQNKLFSDYLADSKETVKAAYLFLKKAKDYIYYGPPDRYGNKYFRGELTGLGRIEISDSARGPWKILLDPNKLAADGTLSLSEWTPSEDGKRIAYFISERGGSARTMRILDVETGKDLPDVIEYCNSKSILWDRNSHDGFRYDGYVYQDKKWLRLVMHHTIGQPVKEDSPVFKCPADAQRVKPYRLETARYEWIQPYVTNNVCGLLFRPFGSKATFKELSKPAKFSLDPVAECDDGSVLAVTNKDAPQGKLLSFNPGDPSPEKWRTIIPEQDGYILYKAIQRKDKLLAFYKHDAAEAIRVYSLGGKYLYDVPLPIQSMVELARDNTQDDKLLMLISSFKSKGDYYTYDIDKNELIFDSEGPCGHNLNDCIVERLYATSKDGTKVPMTVIRSPDTKLDGTAAVELHGYGGFCKSLDPTYDSPTMHFIRSGGIFVQANLRGGGEFGKDWYDQGRQKNKQNVFDDFIACAEHLIKEKYTVPKRLIISGASNGGLLTASVVLQRSSLFGAVITSVPVTDMFRLNGYWKSDYGDPEKIKRDFNAAARYSPLHNVKRGASYPPHLIMTADHDGTVDPWHSFKLVATLQAQSDPNNVTLLRVEKDAGHGAGTLKEKVTREEAEIFAFIEKAIGPINQQAYKVRLAKEKSANVAPSVVKRKVG